jgi:hypothetical protein
MAEALLPFGKKGPAPLMKTEPTQRMTSDGEIATTSWVYPWFIMPVQHGPSSPHLAPMGLPELEVLGAGWRMVP